MTGVERATSITGQGSDCPSNFTCPNLRPTHAVVGYTRKGFLTARVDVIRMSMKTAQRTGGRRVVFVVVVVVRHEQTRMYTCSSVRVKAPTTVKRVQILIKFVNNTYLPN